MPWNSARALARLDGVPAHVRQHRRVEFGDDARPLAEALGVDAALDAALEQHLHADADAEHRPAAGEPTVDDLVAATARSASMTARKAPTPGTTSPSASSMSPRSAVSRDVGARRARGPSTAECTLPEP